MSAAERDPFGTCPACHHLYRLTAKGVLRVHYDGRASRWAGRPCPGSSVKPKGSVR